MTEAIFKETQDGKQLSPKASGFTLIEILIALIIVAILSSISYLMYNNYIDKAKITVSINTLETVRKAIDEYYTNNSTFPPTVDMATGEDGNGKIVLDAHTVADFKKNLFFVSYNAPQQGTYTLTVRANDRNHTILVLANGQVITQGP